MLKKTEHPCHKSLIGSQIKSTEKKIESVLKNTLLGNGINESKELLNINQNKIIAELQKRVTDLENYMYNLDINDFKKISLKYQRVIERDVTAPPISGQVPSKVTPIKYFDIDNSLIEPQVPNNFLIEENLPKLKVVEKFSHYEKNSISIVFVNLPRAVMDEASEFKMYLELVFKENSNIIIDLTKCFFFDSTFLGVLVSSLKESIRNNGEIRLVMGEDTKSIIFHVTRADKIFKIFDNVDDAIRSFEP